tara:strand:- start:55 stop:963 length:909 start_codon:yes stop_codon:yes gene_type:complete
MKEITVKQMISQEEVDSLEGKFLDHTHYDTIINEDTIIRKENGDPLIVFIKNCIPSNQAKQAYYAFRKAVAPTNNRAIAAGPLNVKVGDVIDGNVVGKLLGGNRYAPVRKDGTLSNSVMGKTVDSGIIGYADRYARIPYCRTTAFTEKNLEDYKKTLPYIQSISDLFRQYLPERWEKQYEMHEQTSNDFKIANTVFTTITVNKNFRTAAHYDKGDLPEGFGNLAVLKTGEYEGAYTVIPKYRVGVDVRNCDLALFDVHELHGNTETFSKKPYERISIICYYRKKMIDCGSAEQELERVKNAG